MADKPDIKIFISYHKESEILKSDILTPIHVGAQNSQVELDMLRDDTGDNISCKNDRYCELTAQYWAWKNCDADYYGFMHYRRQLIFQEVPYPFDDGRPVIYLKLDDEYKRQIGLNDCSIRTEIEGYDLILPLSVDTSTWGAVSNEIQFSCLDNLHAKDFVTVCDTVEELYPEYKDTIAEFRTGRQAYWYNMFIMKKELFQPYCEWLFKILDEAEKKIDFSMYNQQETRTLAFMAERLFSIYLMRLLKDRPGLRVKNLQMSFVKYTEPCMYDTIDESKEKEKDDKDEKPYVSCVERAYGELKGLSSPYDIRSCLLYKDKDIENILAANEIIFYGGGNWCKHLLYYFKRLTVKLPKVIWDQQAEDGQALEGISVQKPDFQKVDKKFAFIVTIRNQQLSNNVVGSLKEAGARVIITNRELVDWLNYKLWLNCGELNETRDICSYTSL